MAEVIVALDLPGGSEALRLLDRLPEARWVKVGSILMTREGPDLVRAAGRAAGSGCSSTSSGTTSPTPWPRRSPRRASSGSRMATVHTLGGAAMMEAAAVAADGRGRPGRRHRADLARSPRLRPGGRDAREVDLAPRSSGRRGSGAGRARRAWSARRTRWRWCGGARARRALDRRARHPAGAADAAGDQVRVATAARGGRRPGPPTWWSAGRCSRPPTRPRRFAGFLEEAAVRRLLTALLLALVPGRLPGPAGAASWTAAAEQARRAWFAHDADGPGGRQPPAPGPAARAPTRPRRWGRSRRRRCCRTSWRRPRRWRRWCGRRGRSSRAGAMSSCSGGTGWRAPRRCGRRVCCWATGWADGVEAGGAPGGRARTERLAKLPACIGFPAVGYIGQLVHKPGPGEAREGSFQRQADLRALQGRQATGRDPHHLQAQSQA